MKTTYQNDRDRKNGVALVIVLGLLSVLTTLAVAFAIAMRVESMAAQNFANSVRAEHLTQAGIARAMEWINYSMITNPLPVAYPRWTNSYGSLTEASASSKGAARCDDILSGEVETNIPGFLLADAQDAVSSNNVTGGCRWEEVVDAAGRTNRVAYLMVNMSGLLDADYMGGKARVWSDSLSEIDIHKIPGIANPTNFFSNRTEHVRYETLPEMLNMNTGMVPDQVRDLFVYSYDPGRDMTFTNVDAKLKTLGIATKDDLMLKSNVNAIAAMDPKTYLDATNKVFQAYKTNLTNYLYKAGFTFKTEDVFWNVVNWIDSDRYPQNDYTVNRPAYVSTEGGEALPLINEIVLKPAGPSNCQFFVELWYPFVVENESWTTNSSVKYSMVIDTIPASGSNNVDITPMAYGQNTEFAVYKSEVMNGVTASVRVIVFEGAKNDRSRLPVDAAMDRTGVVGSKYLTNWWEEVTYTAFTNFYSMEVDDPRSNGKIDYWVKATNDTLDRMNSISDPWGDKATNTFDRQGLPIYVKNGPMENIGEMGYIPLANRENHVPALPTVKHFWCTIDLMNRDEGAYLLDYLTVYPTNRFGHGFVTVNTRDQETLKALFTEMRIGWANNSFNCYTNLHVEDSDVNKLVGDVTQAILDRTMDPTACPRGAISFADLFDGANTYGGPVADKFRAFATWWEGKIQKRYPKFRQNDKVREDAFRNIIELITFRQNIFMIAVAAQVMAPNGKTVEAEKRGLATVYRDSYTGNYFVRSFKWMK